MESDYQPTNKSEPLRLQRLPMSPELEECVKRMGSLQRLAEATGTTRQHIDQLWRERIPLKWLPAVEQATGLPKDRLRPDVFAVRNLGGLDRDDLSDEALRLAQRIDEDAICAMSPQTIHDFVTLRAIVLRLKEERF